MTSNFPRQKPEKQICQIYFVRRGQTCDLDFVICTPAKVDLEVSHRRETAAWKGASLPAEADDRMSGGDGGRFCLQSQDGSY